ncbi:MAG: hypothetical protein ACKVX9_09460 [Blastocatellia bacterium]
MKNDIQENLIHRYLLGDLPEADQAALEERWYSDDESFEQVWESENRLVDRYVRGRLSSAERARFEAHYLASPVHQRRVAAARLLLAEADALAPAPEPSFFARVNAWFRLSPSLQFAMAAGMLLLAAGAVWLLADRARLRGELAAIQRENAARDARERELARMIAAGHGERDQLTRELDRLRRERAEAQPAATSTPPAALTVFSFMLSPTSVRGTTGQPLTVPANADQVQLQLQVEPGEWKRFQATLQTAERAPVWRRRDLSSRGGRLVLALPAARLPHNDYVLILSGVDAAGRVEEINRYSFRVIRE